MKIFSGGLWIGSIGPTKKVAIPASRSKIDIMSGRGNGGRAARYERWDKKYLWHPFTQHFEWEKEPLLIIDSGKGAYLRDMKGKRYLDGVSSLWVNLHGHGHPFLNQAIRKQLSKIAHSTFLGLSHVPAIELGKELAAIAPKGLTRTFYSDNGATAVEVALKMAYQYWLEGKKSVVPAKAGIQAANFSPAKTGSPYWIHNEKLWPVRPEIDVNHGSGAIKTFVPLDDGDNAGTVPSVMKSLKRDGDDGHRAEFLAVKGSYHGDTLGAVSVGGIGAFHSKFKPLLFKSHFAMAPACHRCPYNKTGVRHRFRTEEKVGFVPKPGDRREETGCRWQCLGAVEEILKKKGRRIAAGILEPVVQGAAGVIVMPPGYVSGFSRLCKKYNTLLIADEVATGFGRTGTLFACHQEGVAPDILCLAKALTGGYSPLAATMTTEKIFKRFKAPPHKMKTFFHGHSYTAHPLGAAAALANLRLIKSTKLLEKTRQKAHLLRKELKGLTGLPNVGSVRQAGLMAGIDLVSYPAQMKAGAHICRALLKVGIWLRPLGNTIVLMPPPVISHRDIRRLVRSLKFVLQNEIET